MPPSTETRPAAPRVTIVEVGPRDGLQNERRFLPTEAKLALIAGFRDYGLSRIEATAFVSPRWVPQMADHEAVMRGAQRRDGVVLSALVPNEKGARGDRGGRPGARGLHQRVRNLLAAQYQLHDSRRAQTLPTGARGRSRPWAFRARLPFLRR